MRSWRAPALLSALLVIVTGVVLALPLLLLNHTDGSYLCRGGALADVLRPEPELGADFRRNVAFDSGYACNHSARLQVTLAAVVLMASVGVAGWRVRRVIAGRRRAAPATS